MISTLQSRRHNQSPTTYPFPLPIHLTPGSCSHPIFQPDNLTKHSLIRFPTRPKEFIFITRRAPTFLSPILLCITKLIFSGPVTRTITRNSVSDARVGLIRGGRVEKS